MDSVHDVTDELGFLQFQEFVGRFKLQCPDRTDAHTGWLQTGFYSLYT
jgi:hypothetical protein